MENTLKHTASPAPSVAAFATKRALSAPARASASWVSVLKYVKLIFFSFLILTWTCDGKEDVAKQDGVGAGVVTAHSRGLHGYVGYSASRPPDRANYSMGMGF